MAKKAWVWQRLNEKLCLSVERIGSSPCFPLQHFPQFKVRRAGYEQPPYLFNNRSDCGAWCVVRGLTPTLSLNERRTNVGDLTYPLLTNKRRTLGQPINLTLNDNKRRIGFEVEFAE